ncbi:uncharacterized protein LACBIDRAFT_249253, partial [Laccaria bicolor S238N-H82]
RGLSLSSYLNTGEQMNQHLTMHHTIEEQHLFPILAQKMPQFAKDKDGAHLSSHKGIHDGLEKLSSLLAKWRKSPSTYSPSEMRNCLDGFREVLFRHLDEEVSNLRGENLKKYFTLEEVERFPV